ncbi:phage major capsid protein [Anabaena catenula]|uniref:Phage major capsid protein n=1 Tax=Anabaena catenula FACHB-362 TaxID=2692877 RepID=A0ABR8J7S8_9NOST|nr:phage major capsid protein [Anabaena catenula]MBD2694427.1 phage major capsid protein [Anabaena catenula FACHB-362]
MKTKGKGFAPTKQKRELVIESVETVEPTLIPNEQLEVTEEPTGDGEQRPITGEHSIDTTSVNYRSVSFERAVVNQTDRTIEIPISSEYEVDRGWGIEVLEHTPEAIDLTRLNNGANLLFNHDSDDYIGVVVTSYLKGKRLYAKLYFDVHSKAEQIWQSVVAGVLKNVSIGYQIESVREETNKGVSKYYATRWCPLEVSIVTIPADPSVGVGRTLIGDAQPLTLSTPQTLEVIKENPMTTETVDLNEVRQQERDRITSIEALCAKHNQSREFTAKLVNEGASIEQARSEVLNMLSTEQQSPVQAPIEALGLSRKEEKAYSIRKAIVASLDRDWSKAGFERECSEAIAQKLDKATNGFFVPVRDLQVPMQRATINTGTASQGGNLVATDLNSGRLIEFLRNRSMVLRMGADIMSGLVGNLDIPTEDGVSNIYWISENGAVTQSDATFGKVSFRPKTIGVKSAVTRQMLLQTSEDIEARIRRNLSQSIASGIDIAAINGTGGAMPTGILNAAGVQTVALGTNGAAPTWASIVALETALSGSNADVGSLGYLTNAKVRGKLKTTIRNPSGTDSTWIWEDSAGSDYLVGKLNGYMAGVSNNVPSNLTKGSSGTTLSSIIFGNFQDLMIGEWGILELTTNPYGVGFDAGTVEVRALQTIDIQLARATSFAKIIDAVTV